MTIFRSRLLLPLLILTLGMNTVPRAAELTLDEQFELFMQWFPGEYDNNEQVWQQREDGLAEDDLHERIHHVFLPVSAPDIGEHMFFVLQTMDDDPSKVYRQRLYRFDRLADEDAIRLTIFRMQDEARYRDAAKDPSIIENIAMDELTTLPGCEVYWRHNGEYFDGTMLSGACHFTSQRSGQEIYISDTLRLTDAEIWIGDKAVDADGNYVFGRDLPHINRKVRRYKGWMGVKKNYVNPDYPGDDMFFVGGFSIHNEGGRHSILDDDGKPSGYGIELAQLTYQNTSVPIMKLGIIDEATGKTISYTWAATDSSRIGLNLRWFQAGLTAED